MLRVNFYGGPGVGKSTLAAMTYAYINKNCKVPAELVRESCKMQAWEGTPLDRFDQIVTFANQLQEEHRLHRAGVKVTVSDCPVLLHCVYTNRLDQDMSRHLSEIELMFENEIPSLNFFVAREVEYRSEGRFQTAGEAGKLDQEILDYLQRLRVPCYVIYPSRDLDLVYATVKEAIKSRQDYPRDRPHEPQSRNGEIPTGIHLDKLTDPVYDRKLRDLASGRTSSDPVVHKIQGPYS